MEKLQPLNQKQIEQILDALRGSEKTRKND